jgi:hypothetical protein
MADSTAVRKINGFSISLNVLSLEDHVGVHIKLAVLKGKALEFACSDIVPHDSAVFIADGDVLTEDMRFKPKRGATYKKKIALLIAQELSLKSTGAGTHLLTWGHKGVSAVF